ncbi:hypothetical protein [Streptomyces sp. SPB074]|uniref:hypothetical protein n=1 Tax=Streptomyces sp. (strain SPB074) TaxID=465543 RepID=UPI00017F10CE|nr:hypothetical protein [Streptomyces sp. SPB074]EDY44977.1 hypothetical protein SSBG_02992 [Streptomyces sp. SPB074]EDY45750.1 hypothetical protein SSBG_03743 [Streptomyces sp. SPB074]
MFGIAWTVVCLARTRLTPRPPFEGEVAAVAAVAYVRRWWVLTAIALAQLMLILDNTHRM